MAETHDTIDGLLAEFRGYASGMPPSYNVTMSWADFRMMLDRLEAAHKREAVTGSNQLREALRKLNDLLYIGADGEVHGALGKASEIESTIKDAIAEPATAEKTSAVGDCAKLREALRKINSLCGIGVVEISSFEIGSICDDALAAPPRNCDVYDSYSDAIRAFEDSENAEDYEDMAEWLYDLATEGGNDADE